MTGAEMGVVLAVFLACTVESVEIATIALALGMTRGWQATLLGVGTGFTTVGVVIAVFGPALALVPLSPLRVIVGAVLLYFGAGWLRKAVLRHAGLKAKHDERAIYEHEAEFARAEGLPRGFDAYAFAGAFKSTSLELAEVAIIVLTLGSSNVTLASGAALLALILVGLLAFAVRRPLTRVPENALKFGVAVMLVSFGAFWLLEGVGFAWPSGDAALLVLVPSVLLGSLGAARLLRGRRVVAEAG